MSNNNQNAAPTNGQRISIDQAIQHAIKLHSAGQLAKARDLLAQVLKNAPNNGFALHLQGLISHQMGNTTGGINYLEKAIKIQPKEAQYLSNLGEMYRCVKRVDQALAMNKKALKLNGTSASILSNLGLAYFDAGDFEKAQNFQERAIAINPNHIPALNNLGGLLRKANKPLEAMECFKKVVSLAPNHAEALNNLGAALTANEQPKEAVDFLVRAINLRPNWAAAHSNIGTALLELEVYDRAKMGFEEAIKLDPNLVSAIQGLSRIELNNKNTDQALVLAKRADTLQPKNADNLRFIGNVYREMGKTDKALIAYNQSLQIDANFEPALIDRGDLFVEMGDLVKAQSDFSVAIHNNPQSLRPRIALAKAAKVTSAEDPNLSWLTAFDANNPDLPEQKAVALQYVLGKAFNDVKKYDLAFQHYARGAKLKRAKVEYSVERNQLRNDAIKSFFSEDKINKLRGMKNNDATPIFVLGMPRSGTTLTEQIIASHPHVFGAGELNYLLDMVNFRGKSPEDCYPQSLVALEKADFQKMGQEYLAKLKKLGPKSPHITDKMPANHYILGLIHLILPKAKIVHVNRSPVDTCLSGYFQSFKNGQLHSYDLYESGRYYRDYNDLMSYWRDTLPAGSFYDVQYEELVADIGNEARKLIEYCGLQWDDRCLDFHKTKRSVKTASVTQVRQPIYNTSVERWRVYEKHLGPLFDGLGDLAPQR